MNIIEYIIKIDENSRDIVMRYVLRSPVRQLARPCIFDASIACSQNPICPEDVIERMLFLSKTPSIDIFCHKKKMYTQANIC